MKVLKTILIVILVIILAAAAALGVLIYSMGNPTPLISEGDGTKVVCVGDSITYGQGVMGSRKTDTFTAILSELTGYTVKNYGLSNRTLLSTGNFPYTEEDFFASSQAENADIYVIMLGSNDSKPQFWNKEQFTEEYREFIKTYLDLECAPTVYVMIPPAIFIEQDGGNCDDATVGGELAECVRSLGEELGVEVIDLYSLTEGHSEWFSDGLHPNAEGNRAIAEEIAKYVK